jgi:predicted permease
VSASLWQLFDAKPVIGRFFGPNEDRDPGGARVAVLSYSYWQSQYAGADSVLGKLINIGPTQWTIIGVAPRRFAATQMKAPIAFVPIAVSAVDGFGSMWDRYRNTYNITWLELFARSKDGISVEAMTADLTSAYRRSYEAQIAIERRTLPIDVAKPRVVLYPVFEERGPEPSATTKVATWLLGVAAVVLLIACANVGNLLLGRALRRRREIAVRLALGIGRARLASQLLIESLVLASLGAIAGLLVAHWGGRAMRAVLMPQVEWESTIADGRVLMFAAVTAVLAGILAGVAPIFQSGRTDVATALKAGAREGYGHRSRLRAFLLVMQAALSVVLLVGAGLFVRSLQNVNAVDMGYDADKIVWVEPQMRGTRLDSVQQRMLLERLKGGAREYPGVEDVTVALTVPFSTTYSDDVFLPGQSSASKLGDFIMQGASTGYFNTTGTRIIRGRSFDVEDRAGSPLVAIVSKAMADGLWPQQDAIGKCIKTSADTAPCRTVIGVAEDVKFGSFASEWNLVLYLPEAQLGSNYYSLFVRMRGDAATASDGLRRFLQDRMPGIAYLTAKPMNDVIEPQMRSWQLGATMFAVFGGLALALAAIGLYSVVAHSVVQRTHEVGVRIALGARSGDVIGLIVRESVAVVLVGVVVGAAAAMIAARWVKPLLFEISPRDPIVLLIVGLLLPAVAVAASMIPALRATRVDPNVALRAG